MASPARFPGLEHLLGAYLHQDWDAEGDDWPEIVRKYLRKTTAEQAAASATEIDVLLAEDETEERLEERVLREFGCGYDARPEADGPGFRIWLAQVAARLQKAASA